MKRVMTWMIAALLIGSVVGCRFDVHDDDHDHPDHHYHDHDYDHDRD